MRGRLGTIGIGAVLLVALSGLAGCSGGDGGDAASGGGTAAVMREGTGGAVGDYDAVGAVAGEKTPGVDAAQTAALRLPELGPSVIKTASLRLELKRDGFEDALHDARQAAVAAGGFVVSSATTGEHGGDLVLRVPAEKFGAVLEELEGLGDVKGERVEGTDVTAEFVDLDARRRNLEAQEAVLIDLMAKAQTVADTIRVQNELSRVQGSIEQIEGRLRYLRDQTSYSTIALTMTEAGVAAPSTPSALDQAWQEAKDNATSVVTAVIEGAGLVIPLAILLGAAALAGVAVWRRIEGRRAAGPDAPAQA